MKIDWKKVVREIPEEEQLKILEERRRKWKPDESLDGFIETWRKTFTYKGIKFQLAILRYYDLDDGFRPMLRRISDRHVVVEYPKSTQSLANFLRSLGWNNFLWYDTLHSWNDTQTLEEQLDEAYEYAIKCIDDLPKFLKKKERELKKTIEKIRRWKVKIAKGGRR